MSITYYSIAEIFFAASTTVIGSLLRAYTHAQVQCGDIDPHHPNEQSKLHNAFEELQQVTLVGEIDQA